MRKKLLGIDCEVVDLGVPIRRLLANADAHPEHDMGCVSCGASFLKADGHKCKSRIPIIVRRRVPTQDQEGET